MSTRHIHIIHGTDQWAIATFTWYMELTNEHEAHELSTWDGPMSMGHIHMIHGLTNEYMHIHLKQETGQQNTRLSKFSVVQNVMSKSSKHCWTEYFYEVQMYLWHKATKRKVRSILTGTIPLSRQWSTLAWEFLTISGNSVITWLIGTNSVVP